MSEYQYYEFLSIDRPLTRQEMQELRAVSTRATITSTHFVNEYDWGDLKADPARWMERYFDAFLYFANWGTHRLMLRLPSLLLPLQRARQYCARNPAEARGAGGFTILDFTSNEEPEDEWYDEGGGVLAALVPVRADLAAGDPRALYLGWLLRVQAGEVAEDEPEPPVPPGLARLTASLQTFADFLRIDPDLVAAAAERSPDLEEIAPREDLERWIAALPEDERNDLLVRVASGDAALARAELQRRFRETRRGSRPDATEPRTAAELLDAAEEKAEARRRREAERAARERARQEREEAEALGRRLDELVKREDEAWRRVDDLIAERKPASYDEAVTLLGDLRALGARERRADEAARRIAALRKEHARKRTFLARLRKQGLG